MKFGFGKNIVLTALLFTLLPVSVYPESSEESLFAEAESFYYSQNYSLALESFDAFVTRFPLSGLIPDVQYRRAVTLFHLKRFDESLALLERIEKRHRATRYFSFIPFWKALVFTYQKEYAKALKFFSLYAGKGQDANLDAQAWYYKAVCEAELSDYPAAETSVKKFLNDYPGSELGPHGLILLAFLHLKRGNPDGVIALASDSRTGSLPPALKESFMLSYADALALKNRNAEAEDAYRALLAGTDRVAAVALAKLFTIAQKKNALKDMEELVKVAEKRFGDNPVFLVDFQTNIGIASYQAGQLERAEYYFNRAWSFRDSLVVPESVPLYLSELMVKKGNQAGALAVLEEYLAGKGQASEEVLFRAARLTLAQKEYAKGISLLNRFRERFPKSLKTADADYLLAFALYLTGETDKGLAAVSSLDSLGNDHPLKADAVRLQSKLYLKKGDTGRAFAVLDGYIKVKGGDFEVQRDYFNVLFFQKKYKEIIGIVKSLNKTYPSLKKENPAFYFIFRYFEGLSHIAEKEYTSALYSFQEFDTAAGRQEIAEVASSALFYRGWALYRLGKFPEALRVFQDFNKKYPAHEFYLKSLYLAGWCAYSAARYADAVTAFTLLSEKAVDPETTVKARYFLARSLLSMGRPDEAAGIFAALSEKYPNSEFTDDSLFEYAGILAAAGKTEPAAALYLKLADSHPKSPLAEEAVYNRARLYYGAGSFAKAFEGFSLYLSRYLKGNLADAALYWGGMAAWSLKNDENAVSLWERLIRDYRESPFRSEALKKTAEIKKKNGKYDAALTLYLALIEQYPKEAEAIGAAEIARELRFRVLGMGEREAELSARVEREKGKATRAGRNAMLELAALYLDERKPYQPETALNLVNQVLEVKGEADTAARAGFLLGEYYAQKKDYRQAGNQFLKAALANPADQDLTAHSIFRSAEMMKAAGDAATVRELVNRLVEKFPSSPWTAQGKKLLEGLP